MPTAPSHGSVPADLLHAATRAWPTQTVIAMRGQPRPLSHRAPHPVVAAVKAPLHEEHALSLVGIRNGLRHYFGACVYQGVKCTFDFWFPHLGIAVDTEDTGAALSPQRPWSRRGRSGLLASDRDARPLRRCMNDEERKAKTDWCAAVGIIYVSPEDANDLEMLGELAARRRGEVVDG